MKIVGWIVDGVVRRGRELRALIKRVRPDILTISEMKTTTTGILQQGWPGTGIEYVPAIWKTVNAAQRAGTAIMILPGLGYSVAHVYKEGGESGMGVIQGITVDIEEVTRVKCAYVSPTVTERELQEFLSEFIANGKGPDVLIGDLNTRHGHWDERTNVRARELMSHIGGKRNSVVALPGPTYRPRGEVGLAHQKFGSQT